MNTNALIIEADKLQQQAYQVLENLDLLHTLSKYGQPNVVGSVAMGLMTWRDIDIDVLVAGEIKEEGFWHIAKYLLSQQNVTLVTLVDNRQCLEKNRPLSMYIGGHFQANGGLNWKIDIRLVFEQHSIAHEQMDDMASKLTECKKRAILDIKHVVAQDPRYRHEISSVDIYKAVLDNGVVDLVGFKGYLREKGIEL